MPNALAESLQQLVSGLMSAAQAQGIDQLIELDLSLSQARTLLVLGPAAEPLPIHRIACDIGLSVAAAGRNVDRLLALGLVSRTENPEDRRVKLVALTDDGRAVLATHFAPKRAALRAFSERLPADQAEALDAAIRGALATGALHPEAPTDPAGEPT